MLVERTFLCLTKQADKQLSARALEVAGGVLRADCVVPTRILTATYQDPNSCKKILMNSKFSSNFNVHVYDLNTNCIYLSK